MKIAAQGKPHLDFLKSRCCCLTNYNFYFYNLSEDHHSVCEWWSSGNYYFSLPSGHMVSKKMGMYCMEFWKWHSRWFSGYRNCSTGPKSFNPPCPVKVSLSKTLFWERQLAGSHNIKVKCRLTHSAVQAYYTQRDPVVLWAVNGLLPETSAVLPPSSDTGILHGQDLIIWTLRSERRKTHDGKCDWLSCCTVFQCIADNYFDNWIK